MLPPGRNTHVKLADDSPTHASIQLFRSLKLLLRHQLKTSACARRLWRARGLKRASCSGRTEDEEEAIQLIERKGEDIQALRYTSNNQQLVLMHYLNTISAIQCNDLLQKDMASYSSVDPFMVSS